MFFPCFFDQFTATLELIFSMKSLHSSGAWAESNRIPCNTPMSPRPDRAKAKVLVRVHACGVCRTDLHVIEGELPILQIAGDSRASGGGRGRAREAPAPTASMSVTA